MTRGKGKDKNDKVELMDKTLTEKRKIMGKKI